MMLSATENIIIELSLGRDVKGDGRGLTTTAKAEFACSDRKKP
jgi:hypothetical protein